MSRIDTLEPAFKEKILALIAECLIRGIRLVCVSARRTIKEQDALYAQGRTKPGEIVTKAKGGQSPHNFGLAADLCPLDQNGNLWWNAPDDVWHVIHDLAEKGSLLGLDSGYDWKFLDRPHVEDVSWKQAQALWKAGKLAVA